MDEVDNVFAVNTLSQFSVIQSFLPDLMDQKVSNIVNMSSLSADPRLPSEPLLRLEGSRQSHERLSSH